VERLSRLLVFVLCVGRPLSCVTTQNLGFFFWSEKSDEKGAGRYIWFFRGAGIGRDSEARDSGRGDHSLPRWGHLLLTMLSAPFARSPIANMMVEHKPAVAFGNLGDQRCSLLSAMAGKVRTATTV
jgi:hypothetical protein